MEMSDEQLEAQNSSVRFDHEWVQVLINLRMKYAKSFTGKRDSATEAWNEILREMRELGAPESITRLKIKKKWMNLIAKYKQLKSDSDAKKQSIWPYFEQIDRAYTRNRGENQPLVEHLGQFSNNNPLLDTNKYSEKEKFMRTLIDLRFKYRYLFTGKKYAAQKGWMVIQNYLPSGEKYSIDQIGKVWHNLVQRYKTLTENEPDHTKITWIYFDQLHKIMSQKDKATRNTIEFVEQQSPNTNSSEGIHNDNQNPFDNITSDDTSEVKPFLIDSTAIAKHEQSNTGQTDETERESTKSTLKVVDNRKLLNAERKRKANTSLDDLLHYLKERDKKRDEQMKELLRIMEDILLHLKQ